MAKIITTAALVAALLGGGSVSTFAASATCTSNNNGSVTCSDDSSSHDAILGALIIGGLVWLGVATGRSAGETGRGRRGAAPVTTLTERQKK